MITGKRVKVYAWIFEEDDPRKCSAAKMVKLGLAIPVKYPRRPPRGALVLDPFADKVISREDREVALNRGIVVVDVSWNKVDTRRFERIVRGRYERRRLPFLRAGNPVNYGIGYKLSSVEAVIAALRIMGFDVEEYIGVYKWCSTFITLNEEILDAYARCSTSCEVEEVEREYLRKLGVVA